MIDLLRVTRSQSVTQSAYFILVGSMWWTRVSAGLLWLPHGPWVRVNAVDLPAAYTIYCTRDQPTAETRDFMYGELSA